MLKRVRELCVRATSQGVKKPPQLVRRGIVMSHLYIVEDLPSLHLAPAAYEAEGFAKVGHTASRGPVAQQPRPLCLGADLARVKDYLRCRPFAVLTLATLLHETRTPSVLDNPGPFFESAFEKQLHRRFNAARSVAKCRYDNRSGCEVYRRRDYADLMDAARAVAEERGFAFRVDSYLVDVPAPYLLILRRGSSFFLPDSLGAHLVTEPDAIGAETLGDFLCHCARLDVPELPVLLKDARLRDAYETCRDAYER
jgi:hypothetical protein